MKKIVIPTLDGSTISPHFGRAPYFTVVDLDDQGNFVISGKITNTGEHFGGTGKPKDFLLSLNPTALIVKEIGPGALAAFEQAGIEVFKTRAAKVEEAMKDYKDGKLEKCDQGCAHSHGEHHR